MQQMTLEQIAQHRSKALNLGLDFCRNIVQNLPEIFKKMKDGQITLCEKCQRIYSIDGRYDYHGNQKCENCGKMDLCHTITPPYELIT